MFVYHEELKNTAQALALLFAALGFLYWSIRGSLHPGLRLLLKADEEPNTANGKHSICVSLELENPGRSSIALQVIEFRVGSLTDRSQVLDHYSIYLRKSRTKDGVVEWEDDRDAKPINLASRDSTQIGHAFLLDRSGLYVVEVLLLAGIPFLYRLGIRSAHMQWRASRVVHVHDCPESTNTR